MALCLFFLYAKITSADWEEDLISLGATIASETEYIPYLDAVVDVASEMFYFFNDNHKCEGSTIDRPWGFLFGLGGLALYPTCDFDTRPHDPSRKLRAEQCGANCCCPDGYYNNPSAINYWKEVFENSDNLAEAAVGCVPCIECSDFIMKQQCEQYSDSITCDCNKLPDSFDDMCNADPIAYCNSYDDLKRALCGGSCNAGHHDACLQHFIHNGHLEISSGARGRPACQQVQCPASTVVGLNLATWRGRGLVTGCCNEDLNNEAGGDDIYLHALRNNGQKFQYAISDLRLTNNHCPSGYKKLTTCCDGGDLNNNAGGDDIYLCYKETHGHDSFVVDLRLTHSRTCNDGANGWEAVRGTANDGELNSNAGGDDIFLCMLKQRCVTDMVTCSVTIDNTLTNVRYNSKDLPVRGDRTNWQIAKTFTYRPVPGGVLEIGGSEYSNGCDGCKCSGLVLECDNGLHSNLQDWTAVGSGSQMDSAPNSGYGSVCRSTSGFSLSGQISNAVKIWPRNGEKYAWFRTIPHPTNGRRKQ